MKSLLIGLSILFASQPASGAAPDSAAGSTRAGSLDLVQVGRWFAEFDSLCTLEGGRMWGASFCGPIVIVDPQTRSVAANRAGPGSALVARGLVFFGALPETIPVANTAVEWLGTRWTMIMSGSISQNLRPRLRLMGHESFHRMQPALGLESPGELNDHLDTADGRFWLQMEWNALQRALLTQADARRAAITDALAFRTARRAKFPKAAVREVALEIHEGLAEYSGFRLVGYSDSLVVRVVAARRADETGFVRSFAYVSGPLYGYLLDEAAAGWRQRVKPTTDLGELLAAATLGDPHHAWGSPAEIEKRARDYGGDTLRVAETAREQQRQSQLAAWRRSLVEGPVVILDLKLVKSSSFDPGRVFPYAEQQVVYTTRTLEAEWGLLTIADGAILENQAAAEGRVSLAGASPDHLMGQGWKLKLADGWRVIPAARSGDYRVAKQ